MKYASIFVFIFIGLFVFGCDSATDPENQLPSWVENKIAQFQQEPVTNPPRVIFRYTYKGARVFYFPPICCDTYGTVCSESGDTLGAPTAALAEMATADCPIFSTRLPIARSFGRIHGIAK